MRYTREQVRYSREQLALYTMRYTREQARINGRIGWIDDWTNGWLNEWTDEDGRMDDLNGWMTPISPISTYRGP